MKRYSYNWLWFFCMVIWGGMEAYWTGLLIEGLYPISISFAMITISALIGLGFLFAFLQSRREVKDEK